MALLLRKRVIAYKGQEVILVMLQMFNDFTPEGICSKDCVTASF